MRDVVIVAAKRTAVGKFGGSLKDTTPVEMGVAVVKAALEEKSIAPDTIDHVILGNVFAAGYGQNIARQVQINAGIPQEKCSFNVSKVCGSGLKAVMLGAQSIQTDEADIVVAGGTEAMSGAAYLSMTNRFGAKLGSVEFKDSMLVDGLTDAFSGIHMGITAENLARKYGISREEQDAYAAQSQQRARAAIEAGRFVDEIVPITVGRGKRAKEFAVDEFPRPDTTAESLSGLPPAFEKEGSVTAGNASGLNDGAAVVLLMSKEKAKDLGIAPLATIKSYASAGVDPAYMGYAPVPATEKALAKAGLSVADLDLSEANEAFAAQALSVMKGLGLNPETTNVNGGAISLGHPIGCSGARILVTLLHELKKREGRYGLATLCIGGGQGVSMVVER
ncbi:acetyl-CoA C-acetyltransferase [Pseudovibrio exalbescens]|uniref:acetyl-CoA C-acetyltransferase n=1 Tax=Pseudovibrio exalbescens TaxID=197461 RepID=UPI000C99E282|nr:acetyl-CoA C-acetyltransferase [Pseudovibrio exalbescens]